MSTQLYDQNIVLDLEFTPVPREVKAALIQEIIQIGAVRVSPTGEILDEFCCYVRPQYARFIRPDIQKLTGIRSEQLAEAPDFAQALRQFSEWVGAGKSRMVTWSGNDRKQIECECAAKGVAMPETMTRWLDLQRVFPYAMGLRQRHQHMSLHKAFSWYDKELTSGDEHEAVIDAVHTAELLQSIMRGEHLEHREAVQRATKPAQPAGESYGIMAGALSALYAKMTGNAPAPAAA